MSREKLIATTKVAARRCLAAKGYISMVDVLMELGRLSKENHDKWRMRHVPSLERVVEGSLAKMSTIARGYREFAREMGLTPSLTVYTSWGRGKRQPLRFSKYGDAKLERGYSTHFVPAKTKPPQANGAPLTIVAPPPSFLPPLSERGNPATPGRKTSQPLRL